MRIAVTGREGQIARSVIERGKASGYDIRAIGRPQLDLAGDPQEIARALKDSLPDVILSSAAYTAVDRAETEIDNAFAVNERGAAAVATAAASLRVPLIHISTDYVFDGSKPAPYVEDDPTGPTSVYGVSKLAGEQAVLAAHPNTAVLRTAWVYSPFGANFVKTMLRLAADLDEVAVVADQFGNPTSALDIADAVLRIASNLTSSNDAGARGIFHLTAQGEASWAEFAEAIFAASASIGGVTARVRPISTAEYPTPARRPANSRLNCEKLRQVHGAQLPDWRSSLPDVVRRLVAQSVDSKVAHQ
jgi:dTDP-4-dehydrorhamnose reductase